MMKQARAQNTKGEADPVQNKTEIAGVEDRASVGFQPEPPGQLFHPDFLDMDELRRQSQQVVAGTAQQSSTASSTASSCPGGGSWQEKVGG
jgi:hypothetical protein